MRLHAVQIIAGLLAAVAVLIAFMALGGAIAGLLAAILASAAIAWIAYVVAKRVLTGRRRTRDVGSQA